MFIIDVPNIPAQEASLMVADATAAETRLQKFDRVIGVCQLSSSDVNSEGSGLGPVEETVLYFRQREHHKIEGQASVSVLQMPKHGVLEGPVNGNFGYFPEKGYIGSDRATLLVEVGGKKIRMEYFFRVMQTVPEAYEGEPSIWEQGYCPVKARVWKISSTPDVNGNNTLVAAEFSGSSQSGLSYPWLIQSQFRVALFQRSERALRAAW